MLEGDAERVVGGGRRRVDGERVTCDRLGFGPVAQPDLAPGQLDDGLDEAGPGLDRLLGTRARVTEAAGQPVRQREHHEGPPVAARVLEGPLRGVDGLRGVARPLALVDDGDHLERKPRLRVEAGGARRDTQRLVEVAAPDQRQGHLAVQGVVVGEAGQALAADAHRVVVPPHHAEPVDLLAVRVDLVGETAPGASRGHPPALTAGGGDGSGGRRARRSRRSRWRRRPRCAPRRTRRRSTAGWHAALRPGRGR